MLNYALIFIAWLLASLALRLVFYVTHLESLWQISLYEQLRAFVSGFGFDAVVIGIMCLLVFLLDTFLCTLQLHRRAKTVSQILLFVCFVTYSFSVCADIVHFEKLRSRLEFQLLYDNVNQLAPIFLTVSASVNFWIFFLLFVLICTLTWWGLFKNPKTSRFFFIEAPSWKQRTVQGIIVLLMSLVYLPEPLWRTKEFVSREKLANILAQNGLYNLSTAAYEYYSHFKSDFELQTLKPEQLTAEYNRLFPNSESLQTLTPRPNKPNIVLILMEYMGATYSSRLTPGEHGHMPFLDSLALRSISFSKISAVATRTHNGFVTTLTSFPSIFGRMITRSHSGRSISSIAQHLPDYRATFFYGGNAHYDHMDIFAQRVGFEVIGGDAMQADHPEFFTSPLTWGYADHEVFDYLDQKLQEMDSDHQPSLSVVLTTTNHEPFDIPESFFETNSDYKEPNEFSGIAYADWSLKRFFTKAEQQKYFENTIFVLIADHGRENSRDSRIKQFHIPLIIYAPHLLPTPMKIDRIGGQTDVVPTLLSLLSDQSPRWPTFGQNLLDGSNHGYSVSRAGDYLYYRKHTSKGGASADVFLEWNIKTDKSALFEIKHDGYTGKSLDHGSEENAALHQSMLHEVKIYFQTMYHNLHNNGLRHRNNDAVQISL